MTTADRLAEACCAHLTLHYRPVTVGGVTSGAWRCSSCDTAFQVAAYRSAPPMVTIPASKVRALAQAWTTREKSADAYQEGYDDARNACADALDLLVHESEGGAK